MKTDLRQYKEHVIESHLGFLRFLQMYFQPSGGWMDFSVNCKNV